jgi:hypothetical protein
MGAEAEKLRVACVPPCLTQKDLLRKERLPPEGDHPRCIKIRRMDRPESHGYVNKSPSYHASFFTDIYVPKYFLSSFSILLETLPKISSVASLKAAIYLLPVAVRRNLR